MDDSIIQQQLTAILTLLKEVLASDLLAVYLFGSATLGGLQPYSDLDLLVISTRASSLSEKQYLVSQLLDISGIYMQGDKFPIELTIVEHAKVKPWHYPPHVDFQYGEWLRQDFIAGVKPWTNKEMPDLAIIITQVLLKNKILYGVAAEQLLPQVPYHDFIKAMTHDLMRLALDLKQDTRNVLLTFARIWSTLATNQIHSKPAAADWAMAHLPAEYQTLPQHAKLTCTGSENEAWDKFTDTLSPCARFMAEQIEQKLSALDLDDKRQRISLAESL